MDHFFSIVSPVRNEGHYIERYLYSLTNQDYPEDKYEIIIVDGDSTDSTREKIDVFMKIHKNISMINNPNKTAPCALNLGIKKSSGDIIVRVDGHAAIQKDYLTKCSKYLDTTHAECVGGVIESINETYIGKAIAIAMSSFFGVGNARFRTNGKAGYVDCLAFGAYRKEVFEKIGLFNEEFIRCQDDEFNYRLRKYGGKIYFTPEIKSYYYPRANLIKLFKQYFNYGMWKIRVLQMHFKTMQPRQFIPALFILSLIIAGLMNAINTNFQFLLFLILILYLIASITASVFTAKKRGIKYLPALPAIFLILHISYGSGFLFGLFKFYGKWFNSQNRLFQSQLNRGESS